MVITAKGTAAAGHKYGAKSCETASKPMAEALMLGAAVAPVVSWLETQSQRPLDHDAI
jgi:hypothetical protein